MTTTPPSPESQQRPEEIKLKIPGFTLAARAWGPADGIKVLALHGWQDNAATFDLLIPKLNPGLRILAIDLPGHGYSDHRPEGVGYSFLEWVTDTHSALNALGWERCAILGHSLGAGIANALAAAWPERVSKIAAIDGFAPRTDHPEAAPRALAEHKAYLDRVQARPRPRTFASVDAACERLLERVNGLTEQGARVLAGRGTRPLEAGRVTWNRDPRIQAGPMMRLSRAQIEAFLRAIQCPVLMVRPRSGWPMREGTLEALVELLGRERMRIETIDGGHHVHLEHPQTVAELVSPFLTETA